MTVTLFISIVTIGAAITSLFTEAIKKAYSNAHKEYSPNMIALANALAVGGVGTCVVYMLMGIPWTVNNIICLFLMCVAVWIGSMIGYDKVIQLISQIASVRKTENEEAND